MLRRLKAALWPPIPLRREPLPSMAPGDLALADEPPVDEADIESALKAINAHRQARLAPPSGPDPTLFFLALQQAEKFAAECLMFGRLKIRASRLDRAFTIWARSQRFCAVAEPEFARAMDLLLAWHGGHRRAIDGTPHYIGCNLKPSVADSLGRSAANQRLGRPGAAVILHQPASE